MKVKRKDVARRAGVSEQTVSYVLNDSRKFSPKVKKRVFDAVKELNYVPNMVAKSLATNKTYSVSVIVHDIANPIFNEIMVGFQDAAHQNQYFVTVCDAHGEIDNYTGNLIARNVEGVFIYVLTGYEDISFIDRFLESGTKVVLGGNINIDNQNITKNVAIIDANHSKGMEQIIKYLYENGHRHVAYLSGLNIHSTLDYRYKAFLKYTALYNMETAATIENEAPYHTNPETGYHLALKMLDSNQKFTAIITTNDLMAYGVIEALTERGIKVPDDISVIGIDDLKFSKYYNPKLSTLGFDKIEFGRMVFQELYNMIHHDQKPRTHLIDTQLVIRDSCKKIKVE